MPSERFDFVGSNGQQLAGRLDLPESRPRAAALFAHCFTCGKDIYSANRLADALTSRNIAVLRFDFTGLGSSEGEFGNGGLTSNIEDLKAAAAAMRERDLAPQLLIGHSLGGAAVLAVAAKIPEVRAIATIGAPFDAAHVLSLFKQHLPTIESAGAAEVHLSGRPFTITREFVADVRRYSSAEHISDLRKAILIMHSPIDAVVGIENGALIFQHAHHPKSFVSLDDSDHLLKRPSDADYVASVDRGLGRSISQARLGPGFLSGRNGDANQRSGNCTFETDHVGAGRSAQRRNSDEFWSRSQYCL